jgi:hypothetical protein
MLDAMGMYLLIRYSATPTMINAITRFINGICLLLSGREEQFVARSSGSATTLLS